MVPDITALDIGLALRSLHYALHSTDPGRRFLFGWLEWKRMKTIGNWWLWSLWWLTGYDGYDGYQLVFDWFSINRLTRTYFLLPDMGIKWQMVLPSLAHYWVAGESSAFLWLVICWFVPLSYGSFYIFCLSRLSHIISTILVLILHYLHFLCCTLNSENGYNWSPLLRRPAMTKIANSEQVTQISIELVGATRSLNLAG